MEESLFIKWVQQFFKGITVEVVETLNNAKGPLAYLHLQMLRSVFSVTGKWESVSSANSLVMADVVAMDSPLPLKRRDSLGRASGDIPKMGMHLQLNEQQLTELDTLVAMNVDDAVIVERIFADTPRAIGGIYERNEKMFLQGLSTGVTLVEDDENTGTGIRVDFGYPDANKFGVTKLFTDVTSTPLADIKRMTDKALLDGNVITRIMTDSATIEKIARTTEAKELYAFQSNFVGSNIPLPNLDQLNNMTQNRYGYVFVPVDRSVILEKNGNRTAVKPWKAGNLIGLTGTQVGTLMYARLAEQNHPVANVTYATPAPYILLSKFRKNQPSLSEHTTSQARVLPVINNVTEIYLLESTVIEA
jgi:hypothetical protein